MDKNYTTGAIKSIENASKLAKSYSSPTIEPEHVIYEFVTSKGSKFKGLLNTKETEDVSKNLINSIRSFNKSDCQVTLSKELNSILIESDIGDGKISEESIFKTALRSERISKLFPADMLMRFDNLESASSFGTEMVEEARKGLFDPVIGREDEIRWIMEVLGKKSKSNPILVGPAGIGKTAIINGLAQLIANNEAPVLKNYKIYNVDIGKLVAGTSHRGEFEERLKTLIENAEKDPKSILFIDEIHCVISAGNGGGEALDAANMLKPALARGLKCIGATTHDEYRKYIEKDPAFARRFVKITVFEPTVNSAITMLRGLRKKYEMYHGTKISDSALVYAVMASKKYIPYRKLPDIAIDLVDTACSSAIISLESEPQEIFNLKNNIWSLELEKTALAIDIERMNSAEEPNIAEKESCGRRISDVVCKIKNCNDRLETLEEEYKRDKSRISRTKELKRRLEDNYQRIEAAKRAGDSYRVVDITNNVVPVLLAELKKVESEEVIGVKHIAEVISKWTNIPAGRLTLKENERLMKMKDRLKSKVFGQDMAIESLSNSIIRSRVGLSSANKPIGSFLFLGPTGVGKTELAKCLSYELFDDYKNMVFLDMSDYANEISVTKLIGAPAGYVGYNEGGSLTEPIKNRPYNVILLDEIDLASPKALNILYQLLDEGRVVDGKNNVIDFTNTVIIMTSNVGQEILVKPDFQENDVAHLQNIVNSKFGFAFCNRIDEILFFRPLSEESLKSILELQLEEINLNLQDRNIRLHLSPTAKASCVNDAYSATYGARPLKRYVQKVFAGAVAEILLETSRNDSDGMLISCYSSSECVDGKIIGDYIYQKS